MSGIACATLGGMLLIGYCSIQMGEGHEFKGPVKVFEVSQFFGYIGIAMFVFEGNGIVLNLNNEAKDKKKYPNILTAAVLTIILFYLLLSMVCYFTYRGITMDYIT